jgi:adenosine deaminase
MEPSDQALRSWLQAMPKAELHLHLDGSLRAATALELLRSRRVDVADAPADVRAMAARLRAPARGHDQAELLRAFDLPVRLLQDADALERVAAELVEDVAGDGTRYAEIRWAPSLHTQHGLSLGDGIGAVVRGAGRAAARGGLVVRLIAVALRTHPPEVADDVAMAAGHFVEDGLTGFDLAGIEVQAPDPLVFRSAFDIARGSGLGISCHAGEWGGAAQVRAALALDPWRIAHGAPAADDPELCAELRDRGTTLDVCPTSNLQAGIGTDGPDAPLPRLLAAGVPVTVSTDNPTVSGITLVDELELVSTRLGLGGQGVIACMRQAYAAAFLHHDEDLRAGLAARFERWLAANPVPPPG